MESFGVARVGGDAGPVGSSALHDVVASMPADELLHGLLKLGVRRRLGKLQKKIPQFGIGRELVAAQAFQTGGDGFRVALLIGAVGVDEKRVSRRIFGGQSDSRSWRRFRALGLRCDGSRRRPGFCSWRSRRFLSGDGCCGLSGCLNVSDGRRLCLGRCHVDGRLFGWHYDDAGVWNGVGEDGIVSVVWTSEIGRLTGGRRLRGRQLDGERRVGGEDA